MESKILDAAANATTFGEIAGYALVIFVIFLGLALLFHGWPTLGRRK